MLISERLANLDWSAIHASLNDRGFALTARILNQQECEDENEHALGRAQKPAKRHALRTVPDRA